jgi:DNA-directed RNA polymerase subunit RPC12/RpoP
MGDPTILFRKNLNRLWKCKDCGSMSEFDEDWKIEVIQDMSNKSQEINLLQSENIRCKKCGSYDVEEIEVK